MKKINKKDNNKQKITFSSVIIIILIFLFLMVLTKSLVNQYNSYKHNTAEELEILREYNKAEKKKSELDAKKKLVDTDNFIENIAREKCKMYMRNERVYRNSNR